MTHPLVAKLDELLDAAVDEGRANWDGYYGRDNTFHMTNIRETDIYKTLVAEITGEPTP